MQSHLSDEKNYTKSLVQIKQKTAEEIIMGLLRCVVCASSSYFETLGSKRGVALSIL